MAGQARPLLPECSKNNKIRGMWKLPKNQKRPENDIGMSRENAACLPVLLEPKSTWENYGCQRPIAIDLQVNARRSVLPAGKSIMCLTQTSATNQQNIPRKNNCTSKWAHCQSVASRKRRALTPLLVPTVRRPSCCIFLLFLLFLLFLQVLLLLFPEAEVLHLLLAPLVLLRSLSSLPLLATGSFVEWVAGLVAAELSTPFLFPICLPS